MFHAYNTHLDHISDEARRLGARAILDHMARDLKRRPLPLTLTGDMNAYPDSAPIQEFLNDKTVHLTNQTPDFPASYHAYGADMAQPTARTWHSRRSTIYSLRALKPWARPRRGALPSSVNICPTITRCAHTWSRAPGKAQKYARPCATEEIMQSEYLLIGEITRPQGVRGEMRVRPYTDDPMRFEDLDEVYVKRGDKYEARGITFVRLNSDDVVIIRMDGVGDANAVEALRGEKLYVDREHAVELPEDADFIVDLIGCRVTDDGNDYGKITDDAARRQRRIYVISGKRGEVSVPALKSVVISVDTKAGEMLLSAARMREVAVFED